MKKSIISILPIILAAMAVFSSCQREELVENPSFIVTDADGNNIMGLDAGTQYTIELNPFQYATSGSSANEILAASKYIVRSNLSWRLVALEEEQDWIRPFPDHGEGDGGFRFLVERNNDQNNDRTAYYNFVLNDGQNDIECPGMLIVHQDRSAEFLKASAASVSIAATGSSKQTVVITSNVSWTYEFIPDESYATADLDWLNDMTEHPETQAIDTIVFSVPDNSDGTIRGATLKISCASKPELDKEIAVVQYGADVEVSGFPVQWIIGIGPENVNFVETFPAQGYIDATTNGGRIYYVSDPDKPDVNGAFTRVVGSGGDPYVTGAWPGDYWEFKSDAAVSAGTILSISFEAATSATGQKFWRLEYRDGEEWIVPSSIRKETTEPGSTIVYTHEMQPSSSDKVKVSATVKYNNTTDAADFRLVCAANWQSSGNGALAAPNGGTMRLSLSNTQSTEWQPTIKCVAAGTEDLSPANIVVTGVYDDLITFEGAPEAPYTFKVTSDKDFYVTADASWLHVSNGSGIAGETKEVALSCDPSGLSVLRTANVTVKSNVTNYIIKVIQSAAGGQLDPLISVNKNNLTVLGEGETFTTYVQANVEYSVEIQDAWITEIPSSRAVVEKKQHSFNAAANLTGVSRVGHIRFYNEEYGVESVLAVTQESFLPRVTVSLDKTVNVVSGAATSLKYHIDANIPYTVSTDADWINFPTTQGVVGVYDVPVSFDANNTEAERTGTVTFANDGYGYSLSIVVKQNPKGVIFYEDFEWLDDWALATTPKPAGRTVETDDLDAYAPQLPTPKVDGVSALQALLDKGYEFTRWNKGTLTTGECIYLQQNYLKVGKTGYHAEVMLPAVSAAPASGSVLTFDWCPMRQGSGKVDPVNLLVVVDNGSASKTFEVPTHGWEDGHVLEWIPAEIDLSEVTIDQNTKVTIRQTDEENAAGTANRWFIDNIVIKAK